LVFCLNKNLATLLRAAVKMNASAHISDQHFFDNLGQFLKLKNESFFLRRNQLGDGSG
jgi:hypothetical protein